MSRLPLSAAALCAVLIFLYPAPSAAAECGILDSGDAYCPDGPPDNLPSLMSRFYSEPPPPQVQGILPRPSIAAWEELEERLEDIERREEERNQRRIGDMDEEEREYLEEKIEESLRKTREAMAAP
jgi:hypothetical protein